MDKKLGAKQQKRCQTGKKKSNGCTQKLPIFANIASLFTEHMVCIHELGCFRWTKRGNENWKPNLYNDVWNLWMAVVKKTMYKMRWEGANTTLGNISCPSAGSRGDHFGSTFVPPCPTTQKKPSQHHAALQTMAGSIALHIFCQIHQIKTPLWNPANTLHGLFCAATLPRVIPVHNQTGRVL